MFGWWSRNDAFVENLTLETNTNILVVGLDNLVSLVVSVTTYWIGEIYFFCVIQTKVKSINLKMILLRHCSSRLRMY